MVPSAVLPVAQDGVSPGVPPAGQTQARHSLIGAPLPTPGGGGLPTWWPNDPLPLIMLVDDNETDNLISRRILELTGSARGVLVETAAGPALRYLEAHAQQPELLPELLFLDINMPLMDGFGFLDRYEALAPTLCRTVRIVVLSSSDNQADIEQIIDRPAVVDFLTKPLTPHQIRSLAA